MSSPTSTTGLGMIGLGIMGRPMALNLLRAGYRLTVFSRTQATIDDLVNAGAKAGRSSASVAAASDIVITMLPDSPDVSAVAEGRDGLFEGSHPNLTWIDMSSISPTVARDLAGRANALGMDALDAPVSGGERSAIDATLSIMVGGPDPVFERCLPVLRSLGKSIIHVGGSGAGQVTKACNQIVVGAAIAAVAEALVLGAKCGVNPARIREALLGGFAQSRVLEVHGERMLNAEFEPGFRIGLHQKDLAIVTDLARHAGVAAPMSAVTSQLMNAAAGHGHGNLDHSAIARVFEDLADCTIRSMVES